MPDSTDLKLIELLQQNSRTSFTELARLVHLSRPSVVERVNRLVESGVIERFTALISLKKIGRPIVMFIHISNIKVSLDEMFTALDREEVLEIYSVTGENNFIVKAATKDIDAMQDMLKELMGYGNLVTSLVIDKYSMQKIVQGPK